MCELAATDLRGHPLAARHRIQRIIRILGDRVQLLELELDHGERLCHVYHLFSFEIQA